MDLSKIKHGDKIVNELLHANHYLTVGELQEKLHLSRRSVFYAFKKINALLIDNHIDPINNVKNLGYFFTDETKALITESVSSKPRRSYSKLERQTIIIWDLINHHMPSISKDMDKFNVSNHTAISDFNHVAQELQKRGLQIKQSSKGKILVGSQISARTWVLEQLNDPHSVLYSLIESNPTELKEIQESLHSLEQKTGNYFSDNAILILSEFMYWLINYLNNPENTLNFLPDNYKDLQAVPLSWSATFLEKHSVHNSLETQFLAQILYTNQFSSINTSDQLNREMHAVTRSVINKFNIASGSNIGSYSLEVSLSTHLLSTLYRSSLGIQYRHPDLQSFLDKYHDLFVFTKYAVKPFEEYINKPLNDDEISLIAVYFGGQLRDLHRKTDWNTDVLLVCSSGIGTSVLLKNQLVTRYPNIKFSEPLSVFQFKNCPLDDIKLVISTIELNITENIPTLRVSPLLTKADLRKIDAVLAANDDNEIIPRINANTILDIIGDYARIEDVPGLTNALNNYLDAYNNRYMQTPKAAKPQTELSKIINLNCVTCLGETERSTWQTAITEAFSRLKQSGAVTNKYINKIIELTENKGPYMFLGNGVFLAHAAPQDGVRKLGFSVLVSPRPIQINLPQYNSCDIRIIIALAPIDQKQHLKALAELFQKIQDQGWLTEVQNSTDREHIFNLLINS